MITAHHAWGIAREKETGTHPVRLSNAANSQGVFCFRFLFKKGQFTHVIIDERALNETEIAALSGHGARVVAHDAYDGRTGEHLAFHPPQAPHPSEVPSGLYRKSSKVEMRARPLHHFHGSWRWTIPMALLGRGPARASREEAVRIFCDIHAQSNHERLQARQAAGL